MKKFLILIAFFIFSFNVAFAESYDFYVDENCGDNPDGSKDDPFCEIGDAIEEASKNKKIYINNGEYNEDVELNNGLELYGESEGKVVIKGYVEMDDDSKIEKITVDGSKINIRIKKNASVEIEECTIKNAKRIGIQTAIGGGKVVIKNSNIRNNAKGFYIQENGKMEIVNNKIYKNSEEGVDIRDGVEGEISNNSIYENGESGIELIVGKSKIDIKSNTIKNNKASGITNQYYSEWKSEGEINISSNTISGNKKFGINCGAPSKTDGKIKEDYWRNSITLNSNKIEKNAMGEISKFCAFKKEEDNEEIEISEADRLSAIQKADSEIQTKIEEKSAVDVEIEKRLRTIRNEFETQKNEVHQMVTLMNKESRLKIFFFGYQPRNILKIEEFNKNLEVYIAELNDFSSKTGNPSIKESVRLLKNEIETENESVKEALLQIDEIFSLFGGCRKAMHKLFWK